MRSGTNVTGRERLWPIRPLLAPVMTVFLYSGVIKNLTKRDFKLRYRSSVLGFAWSYLNPLSFMLVMSYVFSVIFRSGISNYPIFLLCGLLPWRFFQVATSQSLESIVGNSSLVTKVYMPRHILVLSTSLANLIGTVIEFTILFPLMIVLGIAIKPTVVFFLPLLAYEFLFVYATSLALGALFVFYRDLKHLWEVFLNLAIWAAPIMYSLEMVPQTFLRIYRLNPLVPIVTSFRDVLMQGTLPTPMTLLQLGITLLVVSIVGRTIFGHFEPRFADELG